MNKKLLLSTTFILFFTFLSYFQISNVYKVSAESSSNKADANALRSALLVQKAISNVASSAYSSVVNIRSEITIQDDNNFSDFFEDFFNKPRKNAPKRSKKSQTLGSGFIVDTEGHILTNNHVVDKAQEVKVILHDESEFIAKVIGRDEKSDIAVIKIDPKGKKITPIKMGNSDDVNIGDFSIAIGNPFGIFSGTFTLGIVSAKGRNSLASIDQDSKYKNYIQTDAPINRGNSGGPLLNIEGKVIGMNTAMYSTQTGSYLGIGFAIPINIVKIVYKDLLKLGFVKRGSLGLGIQEIDSKFQSHYNLKDRNGCIVTEVKKDTPASKAGFKQLDIILKFGNKEVKNCSDLTSDVLYKSLGKEFDVLVLRDSKKIVLQVTPSTEEIVYSNTNNAIESKDSSKVSFLGVDFLDVSTVLKYQSRAFPYLTEDMKGVVVVNIDDSSNLDNEGLMVGNLILSINNFTINNINDLKDFIKKNKETKSFLIQRKLFLYSNKSYKDYVSFIVIERD